MFKSQVSLSFFFLFFLSFSTFAQNEETSTKKNILKTNILGFIGSYYSLSYERVLTPKTSLQFTGGYIDKFLSASMTINSSYTKTSSSGYFGLVEYRYYASSSGSPKGFFIAPFARFQQITLTYESNISSSSTNPNTPNKYSNSHPMFNLGFVVGGQWIFGEKVSLDVWGGPEAYSTNQVTLRDNNNNELMRIQYGNFLPRLGVSVGLFF